LELKEKPGQNHQKHQKFYLDRKKRLLIQQTEEYLIFSI
jgi:hypothetical protein